MRWTPCSGSPRTGRWRLGLVALTLIPGVRVDLMGYLFGDILAVSRGDLAVIWGGAALILALLAWRWRGLLLATLECRLAAAAGIAAARERLVLTVALALLVAVALKVVGVLLITAMLIVPAAAARAFARTPEAMAAMAVGLGAVAAAAGLAGSFRLDTPAGPSIVVAAVALLVLANGSRGPGAARAQDAEASRSIPPRTESGLPRRWRTDFEVLLEIFLEIDEVVGQRQAHRLHLRELLAQAFLQFVAVLRGLGDLVHQHRDLHPKLFQRHALLPCWSGIVGVTIAWTAGGHLIYRKAGGRCASLGSETDHDEEKTDALQDRVPGGRDQPGRCRDRPGRRHLRSPRRPSRGAGAGGGAAAAGLALRGRLQRHLGGRDSRGPGDRGGPGEGSRDPSRRGRRFGDGRAAIHRPRHGGDPRRAVRALRRSHADPAGGGGQRRDADLGAQRGAVRIRDARSCSCPRARRASPNRDG